MSLIHRARCYRVDINYFQYIREFHKKTFSITKVGIYFILLVIYYEAISIFLILPV